MKQVILIGDSIRMGYQSVVEQELAGVAQVHGPADNGGTSRNVLQHLEEWVLSQGADLVHVNCGLHDIKRPFGSETIEVPLAEYAENVRNILQRLKGSGTGVVWATTTPVNQDRHHQTKGFDRLEADVAAYNAAACQIAREMDIPINDLYAVVTQAGRDQMLREDGVHFTPEGSALLGKAVAEYIRAML